tara:strand:+ start:2644 stop:3438 length:795 start_codon:yes stop_codon:yes gene_type:complete
VTSVSLDQFRVLKIGGEEQPQKLLYSVFRTLTDRTFDPPKILLDEDDDSFSEDESGKKFIDQWTPATKKQKKITQEAYIPFDHPHLSLHLRGDKTTISELKELCKALCFNCQSIYETADSYRVPVKDLNHSIEEFIYSRVVGFYTPDDGSAFKWTEQDRNEQLAAGYSSLIDFNAAREKGIAKEVAQESLPQNLIINATVTASLGDWLRLLERATVMRSSYEMKTIVDKIAEEIRKWVPEIYSWWYSGLAKRRSIKKQTKKIAA